VKRCFIDCSEPKQQTRDLPMTPTYESFDPSYTPGAAYACMQKPELDYETPIELRQ